MNTMQPLTHRFPLPAPEFAFAGFTWPRYVATLDWSHNFGRQFKSTQRRIERRRNPTTGPYYHAPTPITKHYDHGARSFYLDDHGAPGLRWAWCDELPDDWLCDVVPTVDHAGWFTDEYGDGEKIRGVVFKLPKGRGYLPGWSMGEGMASCVVTSEWCTLACDAARLADTLAEIAAEEQREYAEERERIEAEEGADQ